MASVGTHEPIERLRPETLDLHRALQSLQEELEAVDWYQQRADATTDPELKAILDHNGDEEKEHAAMLLAWIQRRDARFEAMLEKYLFTEGELTAIEAKEEHAASEKPTGLGPTFSIGSLRRKAPSGSVL